jgi:hypothetical protein
MGDIFELHRPQLTRLEMEALCQYRERVIPVVA